MKDVEDGVFSTQTEQFSSQVVLDLFKEHPEVVRTNLTSYYLVRTTPVVEKGARPPMYIRIHYVGLTSILDLIKVLDQVFETEDNGGTAYLVAVEPKENNVAAAKKIMPFWAAFQEYVIRKGSLTAEVIAKISFKVAARGSVQDEQLRTLNVM